MAYLHAIPGLGDSEEALSFMEFYQNAAVAAERAKARTIVMTRAAKTAAQRAAEAKAAFAKAVAAKDAVAKAAKAAQVKKTTADLSAQLQKTLAALSRARKAAAAAKTATAKKRAQDRVRRLETNASALRQQIASLAPAVGGVGRLALAAASIFLFR